MGKPAITCDFRELYADEYTTPNIKTADGKNVNAFYFKSSTEPVSGCVVYLVDDLDGLEKCEVALNGLEEAEKGISFLMLDGTSERDNRPRLKAVIRKASMTTARRMKNAKAAVEWLHREEGLQVSDIILDGLGIVEVADIASKLKLDYIKH